MTRKEQIIEFGRQQGKPQQDIDAAVAKYESGIKAPSQDSLGSDISTAFKGGLDYAKQGYEDAKVATNPITKTEAGLKQGAGLVQATFSPLAPVTKYLGKGIDAAANVGGITDNPAYQKFAMSNAGKTTARVAEDAQNTSALLSLKGAKPTVNAVKSVPGAIGGVGTKIGESTKGIRNQVGGAMKDIVPESDSFINHQVSQALHLTPSDMSNFFGKMDTDIGRFVADNNLIGENVETTLANIKKFKDENYAAVREHIAEVPKAYKMSQVPRYYDALQQIHEQVDKVKGLEKVAVEVENLMKRDSVTLEDVQHAKELLDDHFQLFKVTGDVKDATAKKGVANMRGELKDFIEKEVKESTGVDIGHMNKNVMGTKALLDASELRTPRGLKSWQPQLGDWATLGFGSFIGGGIVTGIAALFLKKALETPSVRLRIAKIVDSWSDAQKAKAKAELESGVIPNAFRKAVTIKHNGQRITPD